MVGSFAPVHTGHIDAMQSAERALLHLEEDLAATIFAPNSDSYVSVKLDDVEKKWNFEKRVAEFASLESDLVAPSYVDDITGCFPPKRSISEEVIETVAQRTGILAANAVLVVGSDQIGSMEPHIESNRAICVLRPGSLEALLQYEDKKWFRNAVYDGRFIVTARTDMATDISSTAIRALSKDARLGVGA